MSVKSHRCAYKACRTYFEAGTGVSNGVNSWCSDKCQYEHAMHNAKKTKDSRQKIERAEKRQAKERLKSRSDWMREAQIAFNAWIRERDAALSCVSCGNNNNVKVNAGHYRSVGSCPALRFEPLQVWKQCEHCNSYLSGNLINYRIELLRRVGQEKLEWIEGPHDPKKYTIDDLKEIKALYKMKLKELRGVQNKLSC